MPHADLLALKARLPRTWPAFFERYGSFSATQVATIPALLDGANVIVCAPTASGKTAAALAPLIERHCPPERTPGLRILYLAPTRALVNDLAARLAEPLAALGLTLGVKTGDTAFRPQRSPDLLLTTPESVDSLLSTNARLFAPLHALVIDELHLFDGTPRGDQLRVLINRLRRIHAYAVGQGHTAALSLQYAALSATLDAPEATAARYFEMARVIRVGGERSISAEQFAIAPGSSSELHAYLATFRARGWRKALVFCNSRAEVEAYAAAIRPASPFGHDVYTHYSNIDPQRRREIEQQFAQAAAAICFSSSTLELGIDIGTIDVIILIGPPGSTASFLQRIGRGNRRGSITRVACFYRTELERLLFAAHLNPHPSPLAATGHPHPSPLPGGEGTGLSSPSGRGAGGEGAFRPAVAIQQIFSLIKQSPTAALRLAELVELFAGMLTSDDLAEIVGGLTQRAYLQAGRPGEWRAGPRLNTLFDEQATKQPSYSIWSNIQNSSARLIDIRDQNTGQVLASVDSLWFDRDLLTLEGRPVSVEWSDGEALWINSYSGSSVAPPPIYRSAGQLLSYELARLLPEQLGLAAGTAPITASAEGWRWFHFLGDLYGRAALDLLRYRVAAREHGPPGLCLGLPDEHLPSLAWTEPQVTQYLRDKHRQYEPLLDLGPFQQFLPAALRRRAVVEQFNVPRFLAAVAALRPVVAPEALAAELDELLG